MAVIRPFKALRPDPDIADKVASVPYDVVNTEEAREQASGNELNFLRITRSELELPDDADPYAEDVYNKAKENLERITREAPLITDDKPHLYIYELEMAGRTQTGISATFSVDDYDNDIILKHEKTRKVKEDDRTNHIVTTEAQTGIVFLTYRGVDKVDEVVERTKNEEKPVYNFIAPDGIRHTVWIVPDKYTDTIESAFKNDVPKIYIADGHHRAKSASRAREVMQRKNPDHKGNEEYNYMIGVVFPEHELKILPYNRAVKDLNGLEKNDFLGRMQKDWDVEKSGKDTPDSRREICMFLDGEWYTIKLKDDHFENGKLKTAESVGENLDVSLLQNYLLDPVLGIDDPRTNDRIDFIGGIRGTKELERLVKGGNHIVAFSMYPVTVNDLMNISDAGEVMPPKSTWFEPKLRDGLLVHLI